MSRTGPRNPERSFGIAVGGALCLLALFLAWRGRTNRAEIFGAIGAGLLVLGIVYPPLLKWPSALWWRMARVLGYINTRVWLTVLFAVILVPVNAIWRLTGKDPLMRRRSKWPGWSESPPRYRDARHYSRMY